MSEIDEQNYDLDEFVNNYSDNKSNESDSFSKEIQEKYEEHKKTENKNPHRPISSYHNNYSNNAINQNNNPLDKQGSHTGEKGKSQSATVNFNRSNNPPPETRSFDELITLLNESIQKNKINKSRFSDDEDAFFSFEEFKSLLSSNHINFRPEELRIIFNKCSNEQKDFLSMKQFLKQLTFYSSELSIVSESINTSKITNEAEVNNMSNISKEKREDKKDEGMKYINTEYSKFNNDIKDILKGDTLGFKAEFSGVNQSKFKIQERPKTTKYTIESQSISQCDKRSESNDIDVKTDNCKFHEKKNGKNIIEEEKGNNEEKKKKNKFNVRKELQQKIQCMKEEEEIFKNSFAKNKKAYIKSCFIKCQECNKISEMLGSKLRYKIQLIDVGMTKKQGKINPFQTQNETQFFTNDGLNELKCVVYKDEREINIISLTALVVEWRKLNKKMNRTIEENENDLEEKEKEAEKKNYINELMLKRKNEKNERLKEVKDVLIETVRLKTKLKNQYDNLQKKMKLDEKIVIEFMIKAGIEIDFSKKKEKTKEQEKK